MIVELENTLSLFCSILLKHLRYGKLNTPDIAILKYLEYISVTEFFDVILTSLIYSHQLLGNTTCYNINL